MESYKHETIWMKSVRMMPNIKVFVKEDVRPNMTDNMELYITHSHMDQKPYFSSR